MFTPEERSAIDDIRSRYPTPHGAVMGVLHLVQDKYGCISDEHAQGVADLLGIPATHVHGLVSFYEMYHAHPLGRFNLQVCTNVSCLLRGSDGVLDTLRELLGIGPGETTPDGLFTIHEAECLGSCGTAPMMSVNKTYEENLTHESVAALVARLRGTE
jgi:NADH-quinone oxidoreductase subunit E